MNIQKKDLLKSVDKGIISNEQAEKLWLFLNKDSDIKPSFTGLNVSYYFGALLIISAMTWFATEAFSRFNSAGLAVISMIYILLFTFVGAKLIKNIQTYIPGGLLLTVAVFIVPLFVFSLQSYLGIWGEFAPGDYNDYYQWIKSGWFTMEVVTIIVATIFIYKFRFPFITFPLSFTVWFMSMDIVPLIFGKTYGLYDERRIISIIFGLIMIIIGYYIDRRTDKDYSFWMYLFGLIAFWGSLSIVWSEGDFGKLIYCLINMFLIIISVLFNRKVFIVFGASGVFAYLSYLSYRVFKNSIMFPIVLSMIGLLIIFLAVMYKKNQKKIEETVLKLIPERLIKFLPQNRE